MQVRDWCVFIKNYFVKKAVSSHVCINYGLLITDITVVNKNCIFCAIFLFVKVILISVINKVSTVMRVFYFNHSITA